MNIYHLYNLKLGSRYPLMIHEGLAEMASLGEIGFQSNHPRPPIWGQMPDSEPGEDEIKQALSEADFIFRPSASHFGMPQWDAFIRANDLWGKIICYDFKDTEGVDREMLDKCLLYAKRSVAVGLRQRRGKIIHVPYAALNIYYEGQADERDIDALYLITPNPDSPFERSRQQVYEALKAANLSNVMVGQPTREGRRAVFLPKNEANPFVQYLNLLRRAKIVVTVEPDHAGGDSRLWEAFASGAMVMCNYLNEPLEVAGYSHIQYIGFSPAHCTPDSLKDTITQRLQDAYTEKRAANAYEYVKRMHRSVNRVRKIINEATK